MGIQSNVNKLISTFGVLANLTPMAQKQREQRQIKQEEETHARSVEREKKELTSKFEAAKKSIEGLEKSEDKNLESAKLMYESATSAGKKLYQKYPSTELGEEIGRYREKQKRAEEEVMRLQDEKRRSEEIRKMILEV